LELESLLNPISPDKPCGESLRWDPVWDEITQLRKTRKDPLDASGDKEPEWPKIVNLATGLLESKTKDLMIAGWLTEAMMRVQGFAGLRDGLKLINGLVEKYWDQLHPLPEDQDLSVRAAPLSWLASGNGGARTPAAMREISLTTLRLPDDGPVLNWNFWNLRRAAPQSKDEKEDAYKKRVAEAEQKRQQFDSAVDTAPIAVYQTILADMDSSIAEINRLAPVLDQKLGEFSPDWTEIRKSIDEIRVFVYGVLKRRGGLPAEATATATNEEANVATPENNQQNRHSGPIRNRAEAMVRLEEAAKFFSDTEPHSPVAYLVRRAIRWAGMPFEDVLGELVKDDKLVKQIAETLGIVSGPSK